MLDKVKYGCQAIGLVAGVIALFLMIPILIGIGSIALMVIFAYCLIKEYNKDDTEDDSS